MGLILTQRGVHRGIVGGIPPNHTIYQQLSSHWWYESVLNLVRNLEIGKLVTG